ncbi:hypothetical protein CEXT_394901 [Caerostris extrusa]|uniref:Uncharacterized protein n=1 Tax=Caerostris extrusa TaxID=172846 RepID=A0AAV4X9U3_CAEEX|nr:hypothetical protein CEXT_394901 [Caerostris extrusa]
MQNNFNKISFPDNRFTPHRSQLILTCPQSVLCRKSKTRPFHKNYLLVSKYRTLPNKLPHLSLRGTRCWWNPPKDPSAKTPSSHFQIGNEAQLSLNVDDSKAENSIHPFPIIPLENSEINREKKDCSSACFKDSKSHQGFLEGSVSHFLASSLKNGVVERFSKLGCVELSCFLKWWHVEIA